MEDPGEDIYRREEDVFHSLDIDAEFFDSLLGFSNLNLCVVDGRGKHVLQRILLKQGDFF